jgi:hypothetical protein
MNNLLNGHQTATKTERRRPELSSQVDRDRLLAQIAQGLLTAHARLDLMEERLKDAAAQAVAHTLSPGLRALEQVRHETQAKLATLGDTLDALGGVEDRLRHATICSLEEQIAGPLAAFHSHEEATRKQVDSVKQILTALSGIEGRFEAAGRAAVVEPLRKVVEGVTQLHGEVRQNSMQAASQGAKDKETTLACVQSASRELRTELERTQREQRALLTTLEQRMTARLDQQARETRQENRQQLDHSRHELGRVLREEASNAQSRHARLASILDMACDQLDRSFRLEAITARRRYRVQMCTMLLGFTGINGVLSLPAIVPKAAWPPYLYLALLCLTLFAWGIFLLVPSGASESTPVKQSR